MFKTKKDRPKIGTPEWEAMRKEHREAATKVSDLFLRLFRTGLMQWEVEELAGLRYLCRSTWRGHRITLQCSGSLDSPLGLETTIQFNDPEGHFFDRIPSLQILGKEIVEAHGDARDIERIMADILAP